MRAKLPSSTPTMDLMPTSLVTRDGMIDMLWVRGNGTSTGGRARPTANASDITSLNDLLLVDGKVRTCRDYVALTRMWPSISSPSAAEVQKEAKERATIILVSMHLNTYFYYWIPSPQLHIHEP